MQRNSLSIAKDANRPDVDREIVIKAVNIGKCYQIYDRPHDRLKQAIVPRLHRLGGPFTARRITPRYFREFWALSDVSFEVKRGESVGVIGRNGAGKSTLLQIVAGTLTPTLGNVYVSGRVGALLELGSGFNPEFTGRENIYLNASLLGLSTSQTDEKFDEIVAFADIGDFIEQPVKIYSSGMLMRVAFSVQTAVQPSLLIIDEALAVGDAKFQKKCYDRMRKYQDNGGTVLFVTHDTHTITQICNRAFILNRGTIYEMGNPHHIAKSYHRLLFGATEPAIVTETDILRERPSASLNVSNAVTEVASDRSPSAREAVETKTSLASPVVRYGSRQVEIIEVGIRDTQGAVTTSLEIHEEYVFYFKVRYNKELTEPSSFGFSITNRQGIEIYATMGGLHDQFLPPAGANAIIEASMELQVLLVPGDYFVSVAVAPLSENYAEEFFDYWFDALYFRVYGHTHSFTTSIVDLNATLSVRHIRT